MQPLTKDQVDVEMAAHGGTIVEIRKDGGKWQVVRDGKLNRRITANTEMQLTGPVAGHDRLKTNADATGTKVFGTVNNCAGGVTPWGTYVMAEENIHGYFSGELPADHKEAANYKRMGIPEGAYDWATYLRAFRSRQGAERTQSFRLDRRGRRQRSDLDRRRSAPRLAASSMRAPNRSSPPTAASSSISATTSASTMSTSSSPPAPSTPTDRAANMDLLDDGTLYVAKFAEDGSIEWLPLVHGQGPLTAENGFASQADVLIETRRAGDLLGATKMDRPEDIQPNAANGKVYVMLTNNTKRKADQVDAANPRAENAFGHIIEIIEEGGDFTATKGKWEVLLKCGDPRWPRSARPSRPRPPPMAGSACRTIAPSIRPAASGSRPTARAPKATGRTDGLWAVDTEGEARATSKLFFRVPIGAEMCGPLFTPDDQTAFVAVQHPGDGGDDWEGFGRPSYYEDLSTRWPDFKDDMPVRPSVVAITKQGGGKIGV